MGRWLARLKSGKDPGTHATKPTKHLQEDEKAGFVGFVAPPQGPLQKTGAIASAANDDLALSELLDAAMLVCDHWQDGPEARDRMRQDVIQTPPHLRADLLAHFQRAYAL